MRVLRQNEQPSVAFIDDFGEAAPACGDDRQTACLGFDQPNAKRFAGKTGGNQQIGGAVVAWQFFAWDCAKEMHPLGQPQTGGELFEPRSVDASASDEQHGTRDVAQRPNRVLDAFPGLQSPDEQQQRRIQRHTGGAHAWVGRHGPKQRGVDAIEHHLGCDAIARRNCGRVECAA